MLLTAMSAPELRAFIQHGVTLNKLIGSGDVQQAGGDCPFCGKENHFFVSTKSKKWDCKSCQLSGGFQTFLKLTVDTAFKRINEPGATELTALSRDRVISVKTLKEFGIGYNQATKAFLLPVYYADGSGRLWDIRRYTIGKGIYGTADCTTGIYNVHRLRDQQDDIVYLCEGEWDTMALAQVIGKKGIAVGVPGAGVFKKDWIELFRGRAVKVLFDNDEAGMKGARKAGLMLRGVVKSLEYVRWESRRKKGFDVRDLCVELNYSKNVLRVIDGLLRDDPPGCTDDHPTQVFSSGSGNGSIASNVSSNQYGTNGVQPDDVYAVYKKWLHIENTDVIDVTYGTVLANRIDGDPVWTLLVAPPSGMKTVPLISLDGCPGIVCRSMFTAPVLISGMNGAMGADPSLIPMLNGKTLVIKDLTPLISKPHEAREEVFSILRDAFDGKVSRQVGGVIREYKSRFGILAGVTPAIELVMHEGAALGERFVKYRPPLPNDMQGLMDRAIGSINKERDMQQELEQISQAVLSHDYSMSQPELNKQQVEQVFYMARFTAKLRGVVARGKYAPNEVLQKPYYELPTRLFKQFVKLALGVGQFRRLQSCDEVVMGIIRHVACDSVPQRMECFVRVLYAADGKDLTSDEISVGVNLPVISCRRVLEDLQLLGIINKASDKTLKPRWRLSDDFTHIIEKGRIYVYVKKCS